MKFSEFQGIVHFCTKMKILVHCYVIGKWIKIDLISVVIRESHVVKHNKLFLEFQGSLSALYCILKKNWIVCFQKCVIYIHLYSLYCVLSAVRVIFNASSRNFRFVK